MSRSSCALLACLLLSIAPPAAAIEGPAVSGRVIQPGGAPLAEVEIVLLPLVDDLTAVGGVLDATPPEPAARARTRPDGRFRIVAPHAGLWQVRAVANGFVPLVTNLAPLIEPRELGSVELQADAGITVRVTDEEGRPVAGARVLLHADEGRRLFAVRTWKPPLRSGTTGEDGTLRLPRGEREEVTVSASAPGRVPARICCLHGNAASVRLVAAQVRALRVVSAGGAAAPDVLVATGEPPHPLARTDDEGRLALVLDPAGETSLVLLAADGRRRTARLTPPREGEPPATLTLPRRLTLSGRVIDADSRAAVAGALVWDRESPLDGAVTGDAGGFELGGPVGRRLGLKAAAPGYLPSPTVDVQLAADGRRGPTLAMRPAAAIEGVALDADGEPVEGAEVTLRERHTPGEMRMRFGGDDGMPQATTDGRGAFRLSPLDPDPTYTLRAEAAGHAAAELDVSGLEPRRTRTGLVVRMSRGKTVTGKVVDGEGRAIGEARVELRPAREPRGGGMIHMLDGSAPDATLAAVSDGDGRFRVAGVPEGKFAIDVRRRGFARASLDGIEVAAGGDDVDVGEIVLAPGELLQGVVRDGDGLPVEAVEIFVTEGGGPAMFVMMGPASRREELPDARTDAAGWFQVPDLSAGTRYNVRARRSSYVDRSERGVELPRFDPLELTLDPASKVGGLVVDSAGEPIPGAAVNLRRSRTMEMGGTAIAMVMGMSETSDREGRFVFEDQEPGGVSMSAVASGYREATLDNVEIPKGEDVLDLELPLETGAVVRGRVLAPDGRPAIGARVTTAGGESGMMDFSGESSDGDGYYRLEGLPPGATSIQATHDDYPRAVKDLEVREGVNELNLEFTGGVAVSGIVTDVAGVPVDNAVARLFPAGRMWGGPTTRSGADGSFRMPGVQDGDYRLSVEAEGYAPWIGDGSVTVEGSPVAGLEARLDPGGTVSGRIDGLDPELFSRVGVRADGPVPRFRQSGVDRQGGFRIEHLAPGTYDVVATLAGSARRAQARVEVAAGEAEQRLDLTFDSGLTLSGRAVQGELPVGGATLFLEGLDSEHEAWSETSQDGRFSVDGVQPGRYRVHLRDFRTHLVFEQEVELATSREIVLEVPTARVAGVVVDSSDRGPLSGVSVTLTPEGADTRRQPLQAMSDLEGRFEVPTVPDGTWRLAAGKQGFAAVSRVVTVQYQKPLESLDLAMDPTEGLTLEVRLPSGSPADWIQTAVLDAAGGLLVAGSHTTGEGGRVRLSSVPPGEWTLLVQAPGAATSTVSARAPGPPLAVALAPACGLVVRVPELVDSGGVAVVRVLDAAGRPFRTLGWSGQPQADWRMSGGAIRFDTLAPGEWTVAVEAGERGRWRGTVTTAPGGRAELVLE